MVSFSHTVGDNCAIFLSPSHCWVAVWGTMLSRSGYSSRQTVNDDGKNSLFWRKIRVGEKVQFFGDSKSKDECAGRERTRARRILGCFGSESFYSQGENSDS